MFRILSLKTIKQLSIYSHGSLLDNLKIKSRVEIAIEPFPQCNQPCLWLYAETLIVTFLLYGALCSTVVA